jgi:hypothetical protein
MVHQGAEADESGAYYDKTLRTGLTQSKLGNVKAIGFFDAVSETHHAVARSRLP